MEISLTLTLGAQDSAAHVLQDFAKMIGAACAGVTNPMTVRTQNVVPSPTPAVEQPKAAEEATPEAPTPHYSLDDLRKAAFEKVKALAGNDKELNGKVRDAIMGFFRARGYEKLVADMPQDVMDALHEEITSLELSMIA